MFGMRLLLTLAVAALAGCALRVAERPAETPIERTPDGRVLVDVMINGAGPYPFILDTGASVTVLETALVEELSLLQSGAPVRVYGVSGVATAPAYSGITLAIGEDFFAPAWVAGLDLPGRDRARGVLGVDVLSRRIVEIDAKKEVLRLWPTAYVPPAGRRVMRVDLSVIPQGLPLVEVEINRTRGLAVLDTGLAGIIVTPELAEKSHIVLRDEPVALVDVMSETVAVRRSGRATIHIGDATWRANGIAILRPDVLDVIDAPAGVILGANIVDGSILVIDLTGKELLIVAERTMMMTTGADMKTRPGSLAR